MFLKIEGINGESQDSDHRNEIDIVAWSWGMSQSGTTHTGSGGGAGKVNIQDLFVTKHLDKASPNLMLYCCSGKHIKEMKLTIRKAGENPLEYVKITMKNGLVSSVSNAASGSDDRVTEEVSFNFEEVKVEYTPQKADGSGDAGIEVGWNSAKNVEM